MNNPQPRIGLLLISAERFCPLGEGTRDGTYLQRKEQEAAILTRHFSEFAQVVFPGIVYTRDQASAAYEQFVSEKVDCVAAMFLSWAEDASWITFLKQNNQFPVILLSLIRENIPFENTADESDFVDFLSCGSLVGFLVASGSFKRFLGDRNPVCIGSMPEICKRLKSFSLACSVRRRMAESTVSLLSCYNEAMWATYTDPYNMFRVFGAELHFLSVAQLEEIVETVTAQEVDTVCEELRRNYPVMSDVDPDKFKASVRASMAMERLAAEFGTDLLVLNDIDKTLFRRIGLRPGFYPTSEGVKLTAVPEGDLGAGLATYLLRLLTRSRVNFMEPFYIDDVRNVFAGGHAGPNDYRAKPENVRISRDVRFAKTDYKYAGAPFAWYVFPAGLKTMLHMSECGGKIKMACTLVECLETSHSLESYSHADFRPVDVSCRELFNQLASFGVTQHYAIVDGDWTNELRDLANLYDIEFLHIH